jgi:tetratricopeptide (TPR) repeat protein
MDQSFSADLSAGSIASLEPGRVSILAAQRGRQRRVLIEAAMQDAAARGFTCRLLATDFEQGGPWAGLRDLFRELVPALEDQAPDLLVQHGYELVTLLPELRRRLSPRNPNLTEMSPENERVRLYHADRALRILHGLIDLLSTWKSRQDGTPWLLVCDDLDRAGYLVRTFLAGLMRRRGEPCRLALLAVCGPGGHSAMASLFPPHLLGSVQSIPCEPDALAAVDPAAEGRAAEALEALAAVKPEEVEAQLSALILRWKLSDRPSRALRWQLLAFRTYTHRGFYQDALGYGEAALAHFETTSPDDERQRLQLCNALSACYSSCGQPQRALSTIQDALVKLTSPLRRCQARYLLAMMYARYLQEKDFARAEAELDAALRDLAEAEVDPSERCFQFAFNRNGLAFIRHRQGKPEEAIRLCRESYRSLVEHLGSSQHQLHKSVLLYNLAQVFAAVGDLENAIAHYTATMGLDPNYSEYYNERGNAYLKLGRLGEALADYEKAIELSAPYPEVHANRGRCLRLQGRTEEAIDSYGRSLDLDPRQPEVFAARAECWESLGRVAPALADYEEALQLRPEQPLLLANRACLLFENGRFVESLEDLDRAITLSPDHPDLYRNRAAAFVALLRPELAVSDLKKYLEISVKAADADEVAEEIARLRPVIASV